MILRMSCTIRGSPDFLGTTNTGLLKAEVLGWITLHLSSSVMCSFMGVSDDHGRRNCFRWMGCCDFILSSKANLLSAQPRSYLSAEKTSEYFPMRCQNLSASCPLKPCLMVFRRKFHLGVLVGLSTVGGVSFRAATSPT